jgi:serine phosphatase RsbU (regulator of sigma subunit)/HAMP domain-containing protein
MANEQIDVGAQKPLTPRKIGRYIKLQTKFGISYIVLAIFTSALLTISLFLISQRALYEDIRKRLLDAVGIAALQMDGDAHSKLSSPNDENSIEYKRIKRTLQLILDIDPDIGYAETMRLKPNGDIIFVVDIETNPKEMAHVGKVYDTPTPLLKNNIATLDRPLIEPKVYTDEYGSWISGYAPFYKSDGSREGIVEIDITADRIKEHELKFLLIALTIFVIMVIISLILGFFMGRGMTASIVKLTDGVKYIAEGDLDKKVEVYSRDEVEDLANAFNKMTDDLKTYIKNLRETTAAKERIESELKIAHDIQTSMLPRIFPPFPDRKEFDIFATMAPAKEVGGDFYDFFLIDENKLCFLIGDVSGKGVPAALFMVISKTLLKTEALRDSSPDKVLFEVNNILFPDNDACMFATVFCVILNIETGELQFANAGHNPPLLCLDGKDFEFIKVKKGFVIGGMENTKFVSEKITLKPGDIFFLYTDGVTEAKNPENQLFSDERLKQILSNLKGKDVTEIIQEVRAEVDTFAQGTPQFDDITMLALKFNSPYAST